MVHYLHFIKIESFLDSWFKCVVFLSNQVVGLKGIARHLGDTMCKSTQRYREPHDMTSVPIDESMQDSSTHSSEDAPLCWICLDIGGDLMYPCKCPRTAHKRCLARWQLQSAGTRKETHCEFCDSTLPDWKSALTPEPQGKEAVVAPAVMNVNFDGKTYSFEVEPGPEGYAKFTESIRKAFNLPEDSELNITFTCDEPTVPELGSLLTLQGPGAYDAAVHCASLSAARRIGNQSHYPGTPIRTSSLPVDFERDSHESQHRSHTADEEHPEGILLRNQSSSALYSSQYYTNELTTSRVVNPFQPHTPSPNIHRHVSMPGPHDVAMQEAQDRMAEAEIRDSQSAAGNHKRRFSGRLSRKVRNLLEMFGNGPTVQ